MAGVAEFFDDTSGVKSKRYNICNKVFAFGYLLWHIKAKQHTDATVTFIHKIKAAEKLCFQVQITLSQKLHKLKGQSIAKKPAMRIMFYVLQLYWSFILPDSVDWYQRQSSWAAKTAPEVKWGSKPQSLPWSCVKMEKNSKRRHSESHISTDFCKHLQTHRAEPALCGIIGSGWLDRMSSGRAEASRRLNIKLLFWNETNTEKTEDIFVTTLC